MLERLSPWRGRKYFLDRMTLGELVIAYFTHHSIQVYLLLAVAGAGYAVASAPSAREPLLALQVVGDGALLAFHHMVKHGPPRGVGVARGNGLGHRELVGLPFAKVLEPADRGVARECGRDEAGLALVVLPHGGVERTFGSVSEDIDLVVLVALANDPAFPLLDLRRQPWDIEMVESLEPQLCIDAGPHRLGTPDQEADLAGADIAEQPLLGLGLFIVLHKRDLRGGHAKPGQLIADKAIGREATGLLDIDRAKIGKDHLRGAGQVVGFAVRAQPSKLPVLTDFINLAS